MPKKKKPAITKPEAHWLNHSQMAKSCGISVVAFRQWGVPPIAKVGRSVYYRVEDVIANRLEQFTDRQKKAGTQLDDPELTRREREERLRLTSAQADGQEIKNEQLRKELAPVAVIEWVVGKAGAQISAILDALPLQLKKRNPKLTAANIETIQREVVKCQNAAAQMSVDLDEYYENNQSPD